MDAVVEVDDVRCVGESASKLAIHCVIDGQYVWIPQSQIHENSEVWKLGDFGTLVIPFWLAKEKGLI